jgi:hypothetical protein
MGKSVTLAALFSIALSPVAAQAGWFSDELPPANAKALSEIIKTVEDKGFKTISDVEFEDGVWKIEAYQADGKEIELKVDPISGEIRR